MFEVLRSILIFFLQIFFTIVFFVFGSPDNEYVNKISKLYGGDDFMGWFKTIRLWDAPLDEINNIVPKSGNILDLGSGDGVTVNYLALRSKKRKILGIEIDKNRLKGAYRGLKNTNFRYGDATKIKMPKTDCIVCFHLLHHLNSFSDQDKLIENCKKALKEKGKLVIVEIDINFSIQYLITYLTDHFIVPILFEKRLYSKIYFRKKKDWVTLLKKHGFNVKAIDASKGKPFSHIILIAGK